MLAEHRLLQKDNITFDEFLKRNKHLFFHQYNRTAFVCCECQSENCNVRKFLEKGNTMNKHIFEQIYDISGREKCNKTVGTSGTNKNAQCICYDVKKKVSLDSFDLGGLDIFLWSTGNLKNDEKEPFTVIKNIYECTASNEDVSSMWSNLGESILQLAEPKRYRSMVKMQMETLNRLRSIVDSCDSLFKKIKRSKYLLIENISLNKTGILTPVFDQVQLNESDTYREY